MVRDRRLGEPGGGGHVAGAGRAVRGKLPHDRQARRICEGTQEADIGIVDVLHPASLSMTFYIDNSRYIVYSPGIETHPTARGITPMDRSTELLLDAIRTERTLAERPAIQERRRFARLAVDIARCCRASIVDRMRTALGRAVSAVPARAR